MYILWIALLTYKLQSILANKRKGKYSTTEWNRENQNTKNTDLSKKLLKKDPCKKEGFTIDDINLLKEREAH